MTYEENLTNVSREAGGDLSGDQFRFVLIAGDGQVDVNTSAGGAVSGVLQNKPGAAGDAATVAIAGVSKVIAGGTIDEGDLIQSDGSGDAIAASTADYVVGIAMTPAADTELCSVQLQIPGAQNN